MIADSAVREMLARSLSWNDAHAGFESLSVECFRLHVAPPLVVELGQVAHAVERARVVGAVELDLQLQGALHEGRRLLEAPQQGEVVGQVVHVQDGHG